MTRWLVLAMMMLPVSLVGASAAQPAADSPPTVHAWLHGLSSAEAETLIRNLQDLQRRLRGGENVFFELLSGAPASYPMTTVSPREAFLGMHFEGATSIERIPTDNRLWQPFKLVLTPDGPGHLMWDVRVVLGFYGNVERVEMFYRPPPPP